MPPSPRDMGATWRSTSEIAVPKQRLLHALQNRLVEYRTWPPGHVIDWHDSNVLERFDLQASAVTLVLGGDPDLRIDEYGNVIDPPSRVPVGIEVLWPPTDAPPAPAPSPVAPQTPQATPPAKEVTDKELRDCILAIRDDHPDDPPDEETLWKEVEKRLGLKVPRDRVRDARKEAAPKWVRPVGRPRKSKQD